MAPRPPGPDTTSRPATKSDVARLKREARRHDEAHDRAYQAGLTGDRESAPGFDAPDSVLDAYNSGVEERSRRAKAKTPRTRAGSDPRPGQGQSSPRRAPGSAAGRSKAAVTRVSAQGASFLLGAIGYALAVSYLEYGWSGVTGWFSAKFTNKVTIGLSANVANGAYAGAHAAAPGTWSTPSSNPNWMGP